MMLSVHGVWCDTLCSVYPVAREVCRPRGSCLPLTHVHACWLLKPPHVRSVHRDQITCAGTTQTFPKSSACASHSFTCQEMPLPKVCRPQHKAPALLCHSVDHTQVCYISGYFHNALPPCFTPGTPSMLFCSKYKRTAAKHHMPILRTAPLTCGPRLHWLPRLEGTCCCWEAPDSGVGGRSRGAGGSPANSSFVRLPCESMPRGTLGAPRSPDLATERASAPDDTSCGRQTRSTALRLLLEEPLTLIHACR